MLKLKIFIFNKLADLVFKVKESSYYKNKGSMSHLQNFKFIGEDCYFHPNSVIRNSQYISVGHNFRASWNLRIEAIDQYKGQKFCPQLKIGNNVSFNTDVHIGCIQHVQIGDNCLLASRIFISDHEHGDTSLDSLLLAPAKRPLQSKGPVIIGDNCWIGEGVAILSGVTIGENCIIATNAVVTKSFPPNVIIGGIPAKIIKTIKD